MTTQRHMGGVVLALAALAGFGDGLAQGRSDTAALQMQLFEATKRTNELAVQQNRQTQQILEQTNALADASVRQSAEAEQTRQLAEASMTQNLQALEYMKSQVERTLQAAQSRKDLTEKFLAFWSAVLGLFVLVAAYLSWREHRNMRTKVALAVEEIRGLGLGELQKVLADLKAAERQLLHEDAARLKETLARKATET